MNYPYHAARLFNTPLMAHPDAALAFAVSFNQIVAAGGQMPAPEGRVSEIDRASRKGYAVADGGIGMLTINGPLVQRAGQINPDCSPITSYQWINAQLSTMVADPEVRAILLEFDSPGGEVANVFELGARFAALQEKTNKPIWASANEDAYSAAYALAAGAERITLPATAMAGSIGVIMLHVDVSRALDKRGYTVTPIYSGARKNDFSPAEPLSKEALAIGQARVDQLRTVFAEYVAGRRGMKADAVINTEAGIFSAAAAVKLGLADEVATLDETLGMLRDRVRNGRSAHVFTPRPAGASTQRGTTMKDDNTPANTAATQQQIDVARAEGVAQGKTEGKAEGKAEGVKEGAAGERARVKSILTADAAKDRPKLAQHLAFGTDMTAEAATAMLGEAGVETAAAGNALAAAMGKVPNPKVGTDVDRSGTDAAPVVISADAIFANRRKASGRDA